MNAADKKAQLTILAQTAVSAFYCPSRRPAACYTNPGYANPKNVNAVSISARTDYAANAGTVGYNWWYGDPGNTPITDSLRR